MAEPEPTTLQLFAGAYLRLRSAVENSDLAEAQWRAGRSPVPKEDTTERAINSVSDPVFFAATDPRRMELRRAVHEAERALRLAEHTIKVAEARLEAAARSSSGLPESQGPA